MLSSLSLSLSLCLSKPGTEVQAQAQARALSVKIHFLFSYSLYSPRLLTLSCSDKAAKEINLNYSLLRLKNYLESMKIIFGIKINIEEYIQINESLILHKTPTCFQPSNIQLDR